MCWNQVKKKKKIVEKENWRKERGRFWNQVERKEKKEEERMESYEYTCVVDKMQEKKKKKGNVWMKERQRIRNHNLKILLQYFYNKS